MIILSIVLLTPSNAALAVPLCLILAMRVSSKFGALRERFYKKRIYLKVLKTPKQKKVEVREFLRAKE
jgi:membrane-bound acyltransferase YfiQ involved in biofilm formation